MLTVFDKSMRYPQRFKKRKIEGYSLFSSSASFDNENQCLGDVFAFSDYFCEPGYGIPMHPHEHFIVISLLIYGTMHFQDNLGNDFIFHAGDTYCFFSSTGYLHSTYVHGEKPSRFISIWVHPNIEVPVPTFENREGAMNQILDGESRVLYYPQNKTCSDCMDSIKVPASIVLRTGFSRVNKIEEHPSSRDSQGLLYVTKGALTVNDVYLTEGCHIRYEQENKLSIIGHPEGSYILIEMNQI